MEIVIDKMAPFGGIELRYRVEKHHPYTWRSYIAGELCAVGVSHREVHDAAKKCMKINSAHYVKAQEKLNAGDQNQVRDDRGDG